MHGDGQAGDNQLQQVIMALQSELSVQNERIQHLQQQQQQQSAPQSGPPMDGFAEVLHNVMQTHRTPGEARKRPEAIAENPSAFDGKNRTHYAAFRFKLRNKMTIDHGHWRNDFERVSHMFSCLSGSAETALRPWVEENAKDQDSVQITTENFFAKLDELFSDREVQDRAFVEMTTLRQRNKTFEDHLATFQRLFMESGETAMSDRAKKAHLRNSLNDELRQVLVGVEEKESFEDYSRQLQSISDRMREERSRQRNYRGQFTPRRGEGRGAPQEQPRRSSAPPAPPAPSMPDVMDWEPTAARGQSAPARRARWVDEEERQRRRGNGACLRCGGKGHLVANCPFLPPTRPIRSGAIAACEVPDAVLEDDESASEEDSEKE